MPDITIMPANMFDTLEFSALVYSGIGAGVLRDACGCPLCAYGHWWDAAGGVGQSVSITHYLSSRRSDRAVRAVNRRRGVRNRDSRISFADWRAELGIVRGDV